MFQVFGQRESGRVTALWIFLQALQTNRGKLAIYFRIPEPRLSRFGFQDQPNGFVGCSAGKGWMAG